MTTDNGGHQAVKMLPAASMVCRQTVNQVVNAASIFVNLGGYAAPRWGKGKLSSHDGHGSCAQFKNSSPPD